MGGPPAWMRGGRGGPMMPPRGGGGMGNGSGVSDIEGVLDGEEEKELRLNAGKQGVVQNDGRSAVQNSDNIWYRVTMVVRVTMVL